MAYICSGPDRILDAAREKLIYLTDAAAVVVRNRWNSAARRINFVAPNPSPE